MPGSRTCAFWIYDWWDGEYWVDVTKTELAGIYVQDTGRKACKKGIDGFLVDNCDVYYHYPTKRMLQRHYKYIIRDSKNMGCMYA